MTSITFFRPGKRLRIFVGEAQEWQGKPLSRAILELAQHYDIAVAIVYRGVEGFGPEHHLSTDRLPDIADNLPIIIEMVDSDEHIAHMLPSLDRIVQRGMMTLSSVEIVQGGRKQ
jgi:hypothetical protein